VLEVRLTTNPKRGQADTRPASRTMIVTGCLPAAVEWNRVRCYALLAAPVNTSRETCDVLRPPVGVSSLARPAAASQEWNPWVCGRRPSRWLFEFSGASPCAVTHERVPPNRW
jgi:hypothetical protein